MLINVELLISSILDSDLIYLVKALVIYRKISMNTYMLRKFTHKWRNTYMYNYTKIYVLSHPCSNVYKLKDHCLHEGIPIHTVLRDNTSVWHSVDYQLDFLLFKIEVYTYMHSKHLVFKSAMKVCKKRVLSGSV